jgi:hypothetical protein
VRRVATICGIEVEPDLGIVLQAATTNSTTDNMAACIGGLQLKGHINLIILFLSPLCSTSMVLLDMDFYRTFLHHYIVGRRSAVL